LRRPTEQAIVEVMAKLVQRDAGARLRNAESLRCARHALRLVDLDEDAEPVEIELGHGELYIKTILRIFFIVPRRNSASCR
jgi:hypothetical protein